ncbi:hypothetical protein NADFUDRAFT_81894, partial [Nadsonia fulvescens var. elongata DSM 6958]
MAKKGSNPTGSSNGNISDEVLTEVSPAPIMNPDELREDLPVERPLSVPTKVRYFFLKYLPYAQKYSSYAFSSFLLMHSATFAIGPLISMDVANTTLSFTNSVYQSSSIEPFLVYGSLGIHILSGLSMRVLKVIDDKVKFDSVSKSTKLISPISKTGIILTPFVLGHIFKARIVPLIVSGDSSFVTMNYISHGFARHPYLSVLVYMPLIVFTGLHVVSGWKKYMNSYGNTSRKLRSVLLGGFFVSSLVSLFKIAVSGATIGYV